MKIRSALLLAGLLTSTSFSQIASAVEPGQGPEAMAQRHGVNLREMVMQRLKGESKGYADIVLQHTAELKLTDEQIGKITRLKQDNEQNVVEMGKKVRETMKLAHEKFLNPSSEEGAIREAAKEHVTVFNDLVDTALKARKAINSVLTADQLQKLKSLKPVH